MKKTITIVLLFSLLFVTISCSSELPDMSESNSDGSEKPNVNTQSDPVLQCTPAKFEIYGDYIYRTDDAEGMIRYHKDTFERSSACLDPICDGSCLLENTSLRKVWDFMGIVDDELYFTVFDGHGVSELIYARMNLVTGKVTEIVRQPVSDDPMQKAIVSNGYLYYLRYDLKEGGAPENSDDYDLYYYRVSIDGGEPERFCAAEKDGDYRYIYFAVGDFLYMYSNRQYIAYNVKTQEERVLYEAPSKCVTYNYYDGKIYYIQTDDNPTIESTYRPGHLYSLDVKTGEAKRLVDDYVARFQVSKDGIYYVLLEERTLYTPRDPEKEPVKASWGKETYHCKHDGTEKTVVLDVENMSMWLDTTVIDGKCFGSVSEFKVIEAERIEDDHFFWDSYGYCTLDLKTGEITPWEQQIP